MVTSAQCVAKYGNPTKYVPNLVIYDVPDGLEIGMIPKRVYCNKDFIKPFEQGIRNLIARGYVKELKTWDGCWNIRKKRTNNSWSLHSWAIAFDVNASENGLGKKPKLSAGFVKCFTDAGFEWGGNWSYPDGMHFQLAKI
ncbi:MAG: M15 family metallopeptidase [Agriterribacter sp.]